MSEHTLSVLVMKEGDWWVAQCLQADLATQVKDLEDVNYQIERMLVGHIVACEKAGIVPFDSLPTAPRYYWDRFNRCQQRLDSVTPPRFSPPAATSKRSVPNAEIRIAA